MTVTCVRCSARWGGYKIEHCTACHLTFSSTRAGDAHRIGQHGVTKGSNRRRCLTLDEMQARKIKSGRLAGEPFFASRINAFGTEVWGLNQGENTRWNVQRHNEERRTEESATQIPENCLEAA